MRFSLFCWMQLLTVPMAVAATQGSLGETSSGSFSIRLAIPPQLQVVAEPSEPSSACIKGRGIDYYSTTLLPQRGSGISPAAPAVTYSTHTNCQDQRVALESVTKDQAVPATILVAPE